MDILKEESDSDLEILEPEVLRKHYRHEELKLITALSKYAENQIPKKWEDFQIFVKNVVKFYLSPHLVRSVWAQLHACYQLAKCTNSCSFVEIIDEEGEEVIKKHKENKIFCNVGKVIHKGLRSGNKGKKSSNENFSDYIEIIDEDKSKSDVKQRNESLICTRGVFRERLKPGNKGDKFSNERSSDSVEIIDEDKATSTVKQKNDCLIYTKEVVHKRSKPGNKVKKLSNEHSSHYLEIIDEHQGKSTVKQKNECMICTRGVIHEGLNPDNQGEKSCDEHSSDSVEIIDEDEGKSAVKKKNECLICTRRVFHEGLNPGNNGENSCDSSDSVEIIDEDKATSTVKQKNECLIYTKEVVHKRLKPGNKGKKFSNEHSSHYVEIIDEEEGKSVVEQQNERLIYTRGVIHEEKSINEHSSDMVIIDEQILIQHRKRFINIGRVNCDELKTDDKGLKCNNELSSDYVNIILDEEEEKQILKQDNDEFINTGIFNRELNSGDKGGKSNYYQLSDHVEISDEEDTIIVEGIDKELQYNVNEKKPNKDLSDCLEISDEESKYGVKSIQQFNNIRGVLYGESKSEINGSTNTQLSDYIKINDEKENTNSDHMTSNYFYKKIDIPKEIPARRFSMPTGHKRNRNGLRCSLPNSIEEAEAEALREKLLLDKIIELELPQVMRSFLNKNNVVSHCTKKRRKSKISTR